MKTITNKFKLALVAVGLLAIGTVSAQTTSGDIGKQAAGTLGSSTGYVKVIDNKGTVKYLQSSNGITQFTDNTPDGGVITTWQLGGTLSTDTAITLNDGTTDHSFTIDGVNYKIENIAQTTGTAATTTAATATGGADEWTVLVRNESTGNVEKILAADLLQVQTIGLDPDYVHSGTAAADVDITVTGLPAITAGTANEFKLFVFRNGVKLRLGVDFNVTADTVTILIAETPMYDGDVIEVQYIR